MPMVSIAAFSLLITVFAVSSLNFCRLWKKENDNYLLNCENTIGAISLINILLKNVNGFMRSKQ